MSQRSGSRRNVDQQWNADANESSPSTDKPTVTSIDIDLARRLASDARFRERYLRVWAAHEVASEIRSMRKRRTMRQADLARQTGTGQSAISRIEKEDYDGWTFKTLLAIAVALKARLRIQLEPIEIIVEKLKAHEDADSSNVQQFSGTTDFAAIGDDVPTAPDGVFDFDGTTHYTEQVM